MAREEFISEGPGGFVLVVSCYGRVVHHGEDLNGSCCFIDQHNYRDGDRSD